MASINQPRIVQPVQTPQHIVRPTARELRAQSIHRLQVGLSGLCTMLLLVGLANIIMDRAGEVEKGDPIEEVIAADQAKPEKKGSNPLADIGVVPATDPEPAPKPSPAPKEEPVLDSAVDPTLDPLVKE